jgi:hypothetical protein
MPSFKHVHKYKRGRLGKGPYSRRVYECALPDCTHYLFEDRIVGKKTICWVCEKVTLIYRDSNGILAKPHCKSCTKKKKEEETFTLPPLNIPTVMP